MKKFVLKCLFPVGFMALLLVAVWLNGYRIGHRHRQVAPAAAKSNAVEIPFPADPTGISNIMAAVFFECDGRQFVGLNKDGLMSVYQVRTSLIPQEKNGNIHSTKQGITTL